MNRIAPILLIMAILTSCGQPEARKPIVRKTSSFMSESIERNKELNEAENEVLRRKMELDSVNQYLNSEQGFWYYYSKRDSVSSQEFPETGDLVFYTYQIRSLDEELIFSFDEVGTKSYFVDKEELISGLQDGLKLMREGERVTFLFPSYKAHGFAGNDRINPNQPLIYEVELIKLNKKK